MSSYNHKSIALISVHGDPAVEIGAEEAGGQNVYVRHLGEALARQGWQVEMFTRQAHADRPAVVEHCPGCRTIRLTAGPTDFIHRDEIFGFLPEFIEQFQQFQQQNGIRYPIVHTNYWLSGWVGLQLQKQGLKHVHVHHSLGAVKYRATASMPPIASKRLDTEQACVETADWMVATSPQEQEHMKSLVSNKGNLCVIPCGTDIQRFGSVGRTEARQRLGIAPETKMVFYIGRFDPRKGIETLVRAVGLSQFRHDERLQLIVGGGSRPDRNDGRERDRIGKLVTELGLDDVTIFPGRISDEDLPAYYAAADVCVVPSHYEPFGLVAIEAMASSTPVVASKVGGLQYSVVSEETGLLVPAKNDEAFANAIDRILADPDWRDRLGQAARARSVKRFSWDGVASQMSDLYESLLESSSRVLDPIGA